MRPVVEELDFREGPLGIEPEEDGRVGKADFVKGLRAEAEGPAGRPEGVARGECGISFFGTAKLAAPLRRGFPRSLDGAPFLFPTETTTLRRSLNQWFEGQRIRPKSCGQFEDSALLKAFGQAGVGIFVAPQVVESEVRRQYNVQLVGRVEAIRERFYAISVERKLKHPAVLAISDAARRSLFKALS